MKIKLLFFIIFASLLGFIFSQKHKIDTDFFSIIEDSKTKKHKEIFLKLNEKLNKQIIILSEDKDFTNLTIKKLENSKLFSKIKHQASTDFKSLLQDINHAKLSLLDKEDYKILQTNPEKFFKKNAKDFFSPLQNRLLNPNQDFFNLAKWSGKNNSNVYFDPKDGTLHVKDKNKDYFFINATLTPNYEPKKLLHVINSIQHSKPKNSSLLISGGAIYSAIGKAQGEKQSLYMSIISLTLTAFLLLFVFKTPKILNLVLVAIFGLSLGLASSFLIFKSVHVISLILSSSLIGLMYDFTIHWLSHNTQKSRILPVKKMKKVFLIGLFVTISGYAIFAFAPLSILKQTAVFSIFALLGAFFCTYFLLPQIFKNDHIQASKISLYYIKCYENLIKKIPSPLHVRAKVILAFGFLSVLGYGFLHVNFQDNIRSYASTSPFWIEQAKEISRLTNSSNQSRFIITKHPQKLLQEFEKQGIKSSSIFDYFLSISEQENIKKVFLQHSKNEKILKIYENLGFDKKLIQKSFSNIQKNQTLHVKDLLALKSFEDLRYFLYKDDSFIIYPKIDNNEKHIKKIAQDFGADYFDFVGSLNESFQNLKTTSIKLKLLGFLLAFGFLWVFYGFKKSFLMTSLVLSSSLLGFSVLSILGLHVNIFSIFGLILASAVGIDYMIFALNSQLDSTQKLLGIALASLTTMISFFTLSFSPTEAVSIFGLSVGLGVLFSAMFASLLSVKISK